MIRNMGLPGSWLVRLNRQHSKYRIPSDDPIAYSRWEFDEGEKVWERFFSDKVTIEGKNILDLGCGPGGKSCYYASLKPDKVCGLDASADMITQAENARLYLVPPGEKVDVEFVLGDASNLPFPDGYFDLITCSDAFEHFPDPEKALIECERVLAPGGQMTVDFAHWGAYNGHHLTDFLRTWWSHIFWSESDVIESVRILAESEKMVSDETDRDGIETFTRRQLDHFKNALNHIRITDFEKYLSKRAKLKVKWRKRTSAHPVLWPLIHIPGVRELAVARNIYILEKLK
jgi:ubiquinone/menaquinone biosynthesis C-methylase UbiE